MFRSNRSKKIVSLGLSQERYDKIKALADETHRTVPSYIRVIIYNYLRRLDRVDATQDDWWVVW